MVKKNKYLGQWSSDRAEARFRAKETVIWQRATYMPEAIDVPTSFGTTRAHHWPGNGPPIVFVHGMTDTSVRWIPFAEALQDHDVYAIDIMGDVGQSVQTVAYSGPADYARWFGETIDGLNLSQPHLVGASLGGYIVLAYAIACGETSDRTPSKIASVIGLDPVGVADLKMMKLMGWSMRCALASFGPESMRHRLASRLRQPLVADKPAMDLLLQAQRGHPIKLPPATVFTDEQLKSIIAPVHVLSGAHSQAFDAETLVARINSIPPAGHARLLPDAGHALTESHFDECLALIRSTVAVARR